MLGRLQELGPLLLGRGVHLGALSALLADRYGQRTAVEDDAATPGLHDGGARSYDEVEHAVARLAAAHRAAGVQRGDVVLVLVANRIDVVLHALALTRLGAVPAPVNPRLKPGEVAAVAASTTARAVVADDELALSLRPQGELGDLRWLRTGDTGDEGASGDSIAAWLGGHEDQVPPPDHLDPGATALMLTTSGTTGVPKAAVLTSRGLLSGIGRLVLAPVGVQAGPRGGRDLVMAALPLPHVMGFSVVLSTLCAGVPLLHRGRFDADEVLDLIERRRPNVFVGVPTMYADLEQAGAAQRDLSSVQLFVSAADAMPTHRARRFQEHGAAMRVRDKPRGTAVFVDIYGMVELSGAAALRVFPPSPLRGVRVPSVSLMLPGMQVRAVDEAGEPVAYGKVGELQFRGAGVLERYEGRDDAGPDAEGWFGTGDFGRIWPGGLFAFAGRTRDRLKVGGFSVFPAEVEEELREHPDVADVAVVGVADERLGERPVAMIVASGDVDVDVDGLLAWCQDHVAGYRRPTEVLVVADLPRGANGKLDRRTATDQAEQLMAEAR
ncbi:MAG TPA: class I adenylate-forming enzyme family protein [Nitriliruptorales bacterium]